MDGSWMVRGGMIIRYPDGRLGTVDVQMRRKPGGPARGALVLEVHGERLDRELHRVMCGRDRAEIDLNTERDVKVEQ